MLQNLDVYVTPVINVDGYIFSWTNDSVSHHLISVHWFISVVPYRRTISSLSREAPTDLSPALPGGICDRIMITLGQIYFIFHSPYII